MIRKINVFIAAAVISAAIPFSGITVSFNASAQDKKTESAEFASKSSDNKTNQDDQMLIKVALVILVIWTGITFYLFQIERKIKRIEEKLKD